MALIHSRDAAETCRLQGVAQALLEIVALPDRLSDEIDAAKFRAETAASAASAPRGPQGY